MVIRLSRRQRVRGTLPGLRCSLTRVKGRAHCFLGFSRGLVLEGTPSQNPHVF